MALAITAVFTPLHDYKKAMILFYDQNSLALYKKIFIDQFEFAVNNYFR